MTETFDVNATLGADELVRLTALQMAERLRAGTTTSVELVQAHLDRIAAHDGDVRADADQRAGERCADARSAGGVMPRARASIDRSRRRSSIE